MQRIDLTVPVKPVLQVAAYQTCDDACMVTLHAGSDVLLMIETLVASYIYCLYQYGCMANHSFQIYNYYTVWPSKSSYIAMHYMNVIIWFYLMHSYIYTV